MEKNSEQCLERNVSRRLFVCNIPKDLPEIGLRRLLNTFGKTKDIFVKHGDEDGDRLKWAIVSYRIVKDAESALRELNNVQPHYLKVSVSTSAGRQQRVNTEKNKMRDSIPMERQILNSDLVRSGTPESELCNKLKSCVHAPRLEGLSLNDCVDEKRGIFHSQGITHNMSISTTCPPPSIEGHKRLQAYMSKEDEFHRYTDEQLCKIRTKLEMYTESQLPIEAPCYEKCIKCRRLTRLFCRCNVPYCSLDCQESHWHIHKYSCLPPICSQNIGLPAEDDRRNENLSKCTKPFVIEDSKMKYTRLDSESDTQLPLVRTVSECSTGSDTARNVDAIEDSKMKYTRLDSKSDTQLPFVRTVSKYSTGSDTGKNIDRPIRSDIAQYRKNLPIAQVPYTSKNIESKKSINERLKVQTNESNRTSKASVTFPPEPNFQNSKASFGPIAANVTLTESTKKAEMVKLSRDAFTKVKVTVPIGPMQYWVQLLDSEMQFLNVMAALNKGLPSCVLYFKPGLICAALFEGIWYRCRVTVTNPDLKVFYMDYGNEEFCTPDNMKLIPQSVENIPAMAIRIELSEGTSTKYSSLKENEVLSVKCVGKSGDIYIVHVEGDSYEKKIQPPPKTKKESYAPLTRTEEKSEVVSSVLTIPSLKVGTKGTVQFRQELDGDDYGVTIVYPEVKTKYVQLMNSLNSLYKTPNVTNYVPAIGDIIAVRLCDESMNKKDWVRAIVLASFADWCNVSLIDYGMVIMVEKTKKLPEEVAAYPECGARCTFINFVVPESKKWCSEQMKMGFEVINKDNTLGTATCIIRSNGKEIGTVVLSRWIPNLNDFQAVLLKNDEKIILTTFYDAETIGFRPASDIFKRALVKIQDVIQVHCSKAPSIEHPENNDVVGCKFHADDKYYRARIVEIDTEEAMVLFIDYCNFQCVDLKDLKPLPAELATFHSLGMKGILRDIVSKTVTTDAIELLSQLIQDEVELETLLKGSLDEGIDLILPTGIVLNEVLNGMLSSALKEKAEVTQQTESKINIFMESDIKNLELPLGKTIDLAVLHKINSFLFMACDASAETMMYVSGTMSENMNEYCESVKGEYSPKNTELCFAKYEDGQWYRALCISETCDEENILFLDFGNTAFVEVSNIRKMTKEFTKVPALAVLCAVKDFCDHDLSQYEKEVIGGLVEVNKIYKASILTVDTLGTYVIELPHLTNTLQEIEDKVQ